MLKIFLLAALIFMSTGLYGSLKEVPRRKPGLTLEYARTPEEQSRGLMWRHELKEDAGMLFIFSEVAPRTFWNKNTFIPLDILWIRGDTVTGVSSLPQVGEAVVTVSSPMPVDQVLEVNAGWAEHHGVHIGDSINKVF